MGYLKTVVIGLALVGMIAFLSSVSFAQEAGVAKKDPAAWKAKYAAELKFLQDSAAALQRVNPDLAKKLSDFANAEANESKEKMGGGKEKVAEGSPEWKAKHEERIKLFKDAAAALRQSHPDLAKSLEEMSK